MPLINGVTVTQSQKDVYDVIAAYAPLADHALVPLAQHQMNVHQSSSGIRTRRKELVLKGLVREVAQTRTGSGRTAKVFEAA